MTHRSRQRTLRGQPIAPKKSLGQNFLLDRDLARWIADQIAPDGAEVVMEIGPGLGALTGHLAGRPRLLALIEKDLQLVEDLRQQFHSRNDVRILAEDAARIDLRPWYRFGDVRVIGNLPYSMGGEILKRFLTQPTPVMMAVFMLQKEVCDRIAAQSDSPDYGALSLLVQKDWDVEVLRVVPPEVFKPKPKVDSAVIRLTPRRPGSLPAFDRQVFGRLVKMGFSQRRKQLKNLLPEPPRGWTALVSRLDVMATVRAEELSLRQWVEIARWFEKRHDEDEGQKGSELFDVVDEGNKIIRQLPRSEVHARNLLHRAVHVFVFNRKGEVFLQKRSHLKDVAPMKWDSSAAGHLDVGESYAAAAVRELAEELGIRDARTELAARIAASEQTDFEFVELHTVRFDGSIRCRPEEIDCGEWFTVEQIDDWVKARPQDFAKGFVRCWMAWRSLAGG